MRKANEFFVEVFSLLWTSGFKPTWCFFHAVVIIHVYAIIVNAHVVQAGFGVLSVISASCHAQGSLTWPIKWLCTEQPWDLRGKSPRCSQTHHFLLQLQAASEGNPRRDSEPRLSSCALQLVHRLSAHKQREREKMSVVMFMPFSFLAICCTLINNQGKIR